MIVVEVEGIEEVQRMLQKLGRSTPPALKTAHQRIGYRLLPEAKENCPISPTKAQYEASLSKGAVKHRAKTALVYTAAGISPGASTLRYKGKKNDRFHPGRLTASVSIMDVDAGHVDIGVPSNSAGGKYAHYIHDQGPDGDGAWRNPGIGTRAKGARAKDKFIERAINENSDKIRDIYVDEVGRLIRKANDAKR